MLVRSILEAKGSGVVTTHGEARIADIVRLLREERIGCVVIVEPGGKVAGIVSERDVVRGLAAEGTSFLNRRASEAMTREVVTCDLDTSVEELMKEMTERRVRHLPVVHAERLRGIVSIGDVVKIRLDELEAEAADLRNYITRA